MTIGETLLKLNSEAYQRAQDIMASHVPVGIVPYQNCAACSQHVKTVNGDIPQWPCDARKLAEVVFKVLASPTYSQKREKYRA